MAKGNRKKHKAKSQSKELTPVKKKIFWAIGFLLPVLFFLVFEIVLRIINYGGNLDLFIDGPPGYENYLRPNLNVARRYFDNEIGIPTPPLQLFHKEKPENSYRIFVLGGSSTAGFPYSSNASFPNILQRGLANKYPDKLVEVINVAMSAVNSYTLLDLTDEILEQSPDAILIYAGHNEYYGALGVGSVQSLGNWPSLVRTYLSLQSFKTFLLLKDIINWLKSQIGKAASGDVDPTNTLMARIVSEQTIPFESDLYKAGIKQFEENLEIIIQKAKAENVDVILSELVSNLRDQKPFISLDENVKTSSKKYYALAKEAESKEDFAKAKSNYILAKEYDALRFRAPEEFNNIINSLSEKYNLGIAAVKEYFENESENKLIGSNLMLEHLHPNSDGYYLIAKAFFDKIDELNLIDGKSSENGIEIEKGKGLTKLDSTYSEMIIRHLKGSWPFQPKSMPNRVFANFKPKNIYEEISYRVIKSSNFNLEAGHMELGKRFEKAGKLSEAFNEYLALATSIPYEMEFYEKAATVLIKMKKYIEASNLLKKSLLYKENQFAYKWIGQVALMDKNYQVAIGNLSKADLSDTQVLFNLSRSYFFNNQIDMARNYQSQLKKIAPNSNYIPYLNRLLK